jgi:hypothetical protein
MLAVPQSRSAGAQRKGCRSKIQILDGSFVQQHLKHKRCRTFCLDVVRAHSNGTQRLPQGDERLEGFPSQLDRSIATMAIPSLAAVIMDPLLGVVDTGASLLPQFPCRSD